MTALSSELKAVLACPRCRGLVSENEGERCLFCSKCQLRYPIKDGVPVMVVEEAVPNLKGTPLAESRRLSFRVTSGPDAGLSFQLDSRTCRAIGRSSDDFERTSVFKMDLALSLDQGTKSLILKYITRQFASEDSESPDSLGGFRRAADVVLTDLALSKLHAMIFAGDDKVGILDLVSKNGTFVNGNEVESCFLRPGDILELGETKIEFEG